jgi:hypothetical protein
MRKKDSKRGTIALALIALVVVVPAGVWLTHRTPNFMEDTSSTIELDPGFQTFPTPRTFDGPGTVFRIDESGTKFPVTQLKIAYQEVGMEQVGTYSRESKWTVGALASFIGGHTSNDATGTIESLMKFGEGHRRRINDVEVDQALDASKIRYKPGSTYYVVHETIAIPSIDIEIRHSESLSPEARVTLDAVSKSNASLKWSDDRKKTLVMRFPELHNVFFTADKVLPPALGVNSPGRPEVIKLKATEQPTWTTEEVGPTEE